MHRAELTIIYAAAAGLVVHLGIIALAKAGVGPPRLLELTGPSFLNALYTPFSFILVYEVFALILALSRSFTSSIGVQYQIISLIFVRRIFGDIGHLGEVDHWTFQNEWVRWLAVDMGGALALFFLVTVFLHLARNTDEQDRPEGVETFVQIKKAVTLTVAGLAVAIGVWSLGISGINVVSHIIEGDVLAIDIDFVFYRDLFTILIFADVFVLLAAYRFSDEFSLIFRNVGFVISTILLRLSMSVPRPWDVTVAAASLVFGICVLAIYRYYQAVNAGEEVEPESDDAVEIA